MKHFSARQLTQAAAIAAIYTVITYLIKPIASGPIQVRISEALTILPYFTPTAIPGLTIGCVISNIIAGAEGAANIFDIVFGSLATLIGAIGSRAICKVNKYLTPIPPIVANMIIIPFILAYAYGIPGGIWYFMLTVGAGEIISCAVLGIPLMLFLEKHHPEKLFE